MLPMTIRSAAWSWKPSLVAGLAVCWAIAGGFTCQATDLGAQSRSLEDAIAKARAAGIPLSASDLVREIPPEQNAAPILKRAFAAMDKLTKADIDALQPPNSPQAISDPKLLLNPAARAAIRKAQPALNLLEEASKLPHCSFDHDPDHGPLELYPEWGSMKKLCRYAAFSAYLHAADGDVAAALRDLRIGASTSRFLAEEGSLLGTNVAGACERIVLDWTVKCMGATRLDADRQGALRQYVALLESQPVPAYDVVRGMKAAAYERIVIARNMTHYLAHPDGHVELPAMLPKGQLPKIEKDRATLAAVLKAWTPPIEKLNKAGDDLDAIRAAIDELDQADVDAPFKDTWINLILIDPPYTTFSDYVVGVTARRRCTLGLAKALVFRAATGGYPESLDQFAPDLTDPFSKQPIRYLRTKRGIRVYSVGPDKVDDSGQTEAEREKPNGETFARTYDLVAAYEPPN